MMSETRTLHFDNARQLQSLYANDLKLLKTMEDSLGVKVTTREGWIKIEGEHDHDQVTGQPVAKPSRQTTMEKTAQEGIQFLKGQP